MLTLPQDLQAYGKIATTIAKKFFNIPGALQPTGQLPHLSAWVTFCVGNIVLAAPPVNKNL